MYASEDNIYAVGYIYILIGPRDSVVFCIDALTIWIFIINACGEGGNKEKKRVEKKPPAFWERKV